MFLYPQGGSMPGKFQEKLPQITINFLRGDFRLIMPR